MQNSNETLEQKISKQPTYFQAEFYQNYEYLTYGLVPHVQQFVESVNEEVPIKQRPHFLAFVKGNNIYHLTPSLPIAELEDFIAKHLDQYKLISQLFANQIKSQAPFDIFPFWNPKQLDWATHEALINKPFIIHQSIFDLVTFFDEHNIDRLIAITQSGKILVMVKHSHNKVIQFTILSNEENNQYKIHIAVERNKTYIVKSHHELIQKIKEINQEFNLLNLKN